MTFQSNHMVGMRKDLRLKVPKLSQTLFSRIVHNNGLFHFIHMQGGGGGCKILGLS